MVGCGRGYVTWLDGKMLLRELRGRRSRLKGVKLLGAIFLILGAVASGSCEASAIQYASIVMDAETGKVISSANERARTYPASLAKMMTLYLTFDALDRGDLKLDQKLPVSAHAAGQAPSKLGLKVNSTITVSDAIRALTTKSANDVAAVLAEALGKTEWQFAQQMTQKARDLGMKNTVFRNASGLPHRQQVTTAYDMALLSRALIRNHPKHYRYFSETSFRHGGKTYRSHNRILTSYEGADGIKTGFINASGFNLAASAVRDGRRLIAVVMGGKSAPTRDKHTATLLEGGFRWMEAQATKGSTPTKLASSTKKNAPAAPASAKPAVAKATTSGNASSGNWAIQVGAFSTRSNALRVATETAGLLTRLPSDARPDALSVRTRDGRTLYRARVIGVSQDAALAACAQLARNKRDCLPVQS